MSFKLCGIVLCIGGWLSAPGQEQPAGESRPPAPPAEVRRFLLGATASFTPLIPMRGGEVTQSFPEGPLEVKAIAESRAKWAGGGAAVQIALSERMALGVNALLRGTGYQLSTENLVGADNPDTIPDERTKTTVTEQTRATYLDVPVLVRRYSKSRFESGLRWFFQAGAAARTVWRVHTSVQSVTGANTTCCDETPARPANRTIFGVVAGGGLHGVDDFGFRVIPEVRYTRWLGTTFDTLSAQSRRDQVEIMITLGF